ncbi:MAG: hypothetical protein ACYC8T_09060 [Myxococcaceae bacterium]
MKSTWAVVAACAAVASFAGCEWESIEHADAGVDAGADAGAGGGGDAGFDAGVDAGVDAGADAGLDAGFDAGIGNVSVYVVGDLTPKSFTDGYAGQTPSAQVFGIARLDLMKSAADPSPVTAFDHGTGAAMIDMISTTPTVAGRAPSSAIAAGTYTHGRVLMTLVRTTIDAVAHAGLVVPGKLTVTSALSDTTVSGSAWAKGDTTYGFVPTGTTVGQSFTGPTPAMPSTAGGSVVQDASHTWLLFPFSTAFTIDPMDTTEVSATVHYEVYRSFRWQDQTATGYAAGVFDLDPGAMSSEPVRNFGATGYYTSTP